ncbi:Ubiquitin family protein [Trichomonas vaginalis G3]|uniref:Ubiquitin family protein n=1 Tax=Trichomonas vaginalis (strain ATCC PRA-98 / G3) TaxID=412133 RepID=A2FER2_TRIV3|nr:cellular macromolecule catabolic process [Trichomonas vaginalis G3]EAX96599.1 Ubiquitin family protein [Trichomonas vaginalis G3]KAI5524098.1 cellular macromolecule catabolic process [Trichomonas vaginalis G3]|eukprot:XP_001309529.1 Ubiquitin family protein [Trichomonas vaginalis G3]
MEPDWKEIARNISDYVDNDTFLSARSPQQIAKILSYAKLSPCEFATLFTNLSNYHGKADILMMLSRARLKDFNSQEEASEISETITSILGIQILDSLFSFYQNKLQQEISETKNHTSQSPVPEYANIDVLLSSGKRWRFDDIDLNTSVENFKSIVHEKTDIPIENLGMISAGQLMRNDHTLKEYKIQNDSTISLFYRHPVNINEILRRYDDLTHEIYIKSLPGNIDTLKGVSLNMTIEDLKIFIDYKLGVYPESQRLIFAGKQMEDENTLMDYNVHDGDTINLALRLCGGKPVIYLYPKEEIDAKVSIKINDGDFSFVYPSFDKDNTWNVKALPSGEIVHRGKKLRYLFWETLFYPNLNMAKDSSSKAKIVSLSSRIS